MDEAILRHFNDILAWFKKKIVLSYQEIPRNGVCVCVRACVVLYLCMNLLGNFRCALSTYQLQRQTNRPSRVVEYIMHYI